MVDTSLGWYRWWGGFIHCMRLGRMWLTLTLAYKAKMGLWGLRGFRVFWVFISWYVCLIMHCRLSRPCIQCVVRNYCLGFIMISAFLNINVHVRQIVIMFPFQFLKTRWKWRTVAAGSIFLDAGVTNSKWWVCIALESRKWRLCR